MALPDGVTRWGGPTYYIPILYTELVSKYKFIMLVLRRVAVLVDNIG